ncbi:flagellar biosynthetic protein FliP [Priestia megaterium]|nr:flagellar biosynthetic protein FliP [Priestia megaterium]
MSRKTIVSFILPFFVFTAFPAITHAAGLIDVSIGDKGGLTDSLKIFILVFLLSIAPALFILLTCFTQVVVVFGLARQGLGTQTVPPNQVLVGLALFVTFFIMSPVFSQIYKDAYVPFEKGTITELQAFKKAEKPLKTFMLKNTNDETIATMYKLKDEKMPNKKEKVSMITLIPSFVLTQLTKGFITGLALYGLFIFIDLIVASILMFLGMIMLPPQMVSLPIKLLTFLSIGGFNSLIEVIYKSIVT